MSREARVERSRPDVKRTTRSPSQLILYGNDELLTCRISFRDCVASTIDAYRNIHRESVAANEQTHLGKREAHNGCASHNGIHASWP